MTQTCSLSSLAPPAVPTDCSEDIGPRLARLHAEIRDRFPPLSRIAVAVYDPDSDELKTFVHSTLGASPLRLYQATLAEVPSLRHLAETNQPRVVDDIALLPDTGQEHTRSIKAGPLRSSYTLPIRHGGRLMGFLFFNATESGFFTPPRQHALKVYIEVISLLIINDLLPVTILKGAVRTAREFSRQRDEETGAHVERMARFSHLIGLTLARERDLPDWYVEYLFHFAPLHDLGKIAVPDAILLKPARLTAEEFAVMQTHVTRGVAIIDTMMEGFGLDGLHHVQMLRNIIAGHHEAMDGSGYPLGLSGPAIPLEARIAAVADVFDALTSARPYKAAWPNARAFALLRDQAGSRFDPACVAALEANATEVTRIQNRFRDPQETAA